MAVLCWVTDFFMGKNSRSNLEINPAALKKLQSFLDDDIGFGDLTSEALIGEKVSARGVIFAKEQMVLAGVQEASNVLQMLGCKVKVLVKDGSSVSGKREVMEVNGNARSILKGERLALNLLSRMSGIATLTRLYVEKARRVNLRVRIAATRKTAPGLNMFDKKAVKIGGGDSHRFRLDDCVLIKDNHLKVLGSIGKAIQLARERASFTKKIEVEVSNLKEALDASREGADIIMLDNIPPKEIRRIVEELEKKNMRKNTILEASGNITLSNLESYAKTGVDVISVGALTHSAHAVDLSLEITDVRS